MDRQPPRGLAQGRRRGRRPRQWEAARQWRRGGGRRDMTSLPRDPGPVKLGLVIDLDICVGCHACAVNCKEWNASGHSAPLTDSDPYGADPRSEEHTSELQSLMRNSYAVFCLKKKKKKHAQ